MVVGPSLLGFLRTQEQPQKGHLKRCISDPGSVSGSNRRHVTKRRISEIKVSSGEKGAVLQEFLSVGENETVVDMAQACVLPSHYLSQVITLPDVSRVK